MSREKSPHRLGARSILVRHPARLVVHVLSLREWSFSGLLASFALSREARVGIPSLWFHRIVVTAPFGGLKLPSMTTAELHPWSYLNRGLSLTVKSAPPDLRSGQLETLY
jgi:hypothetical protein